MRTNIYSHRNLASMCALILALFATAPSGRATDANPPDRITFQGYLTDASGAALGATNPKNYDVVFRVYDALGGGNRKWTEQQTVTVDKGYFSAMLGEGTVVGGEVHPALSSLFVGPTASDRYVEITVKGVSGSADTTLAPRLRLLSAPYACLATTARGLAGTSNIVLVATNNVVLVPANAAMGIGTLNPIAPLDVNGTMMADRVSIGHDATAQTNWSLYVGRSNYVESVLKNMSSGDYISMCIYTNFVNAPCVIQGGSGQNMTINPGGGNLGVGSTSPSSKLDVSGTITADRLNIGRDASAQANWTAYVGKAGGVESVIRDTTTGNYLTFQAGSTLSIHGWNLGAGARPLLLSPTGGNVGIGGTSPRTKLEVRTAEGGWTTAIGNDSYAGSDNLVLGANGNGAIIGAHNSALSAWKSLYLNCSSITQGGDVGMAGKLGLGTISPRTKLEVAGVGINGWIVANFRNSDYPSSDVVALGSRSDGSAGIGVHDSTLSAWRGLWLNASAFNTGNGGNVYMSQSGSLGMGVQPGHRIHLYGGAYCDGTAGWVPASDRAYKREIQDMKQYGLAQVLALRPVTYIHKQDAANRTQIGFIAQEVKPIVPEVAEGEEGSMGLAYDRLVPVLVNAIKEQQAQIQQLKADVEALKAAK